MQSGHTLRFLTTVFSSYRSHQATLQQLFKDYLFAHLCTAYRLWRQMCASCPLVGKWTWWSLRRKHLSFHCLSRTAWHQHQPVHEKRSKTSAGLQRNSSLEHLVLLPALETPIWVKTLQSKSLPVKLLAVHDISNISCASKLANFICKAVAHIWNFGPCLQWPTQRSISRKYGEPYLDLALGPSPCPRFPAWLWRSRGNSNRV